MLLLDFKEPGVNINDERYANSLKCLQKSIKNKHPGKLGLVVQDLVCCMKWEVLQHPPYSPDLSPCDYHVFGTLKKSLKGRRFKLDAEVEFAVSE